jgi:DNA-binding SARP family transcriptional activator
MGTLEIKLFGTLRVQRPGRPVTQFPTKRVKDLFSYLLIHRHTLHPREALAELFWDGTKENNPRHCLNTALWRLQRVLGEPEPGGHRYLRVDAQRIGFNTASDARLDVAEFENRCLWAEQVGAASAEQQASLYHQAITFYQADLLVDCYEEWCLIERERLQRVYLHALDFLIDYHEARREFREARDCALRLLATDPLREDVHRKLIHSFLATGQPAAALKQYQTCKSVLERELGAPPSAATQSLLPRIFGQIGVPGPGPAGRVPGAATVASGPPQGPDASEDLAAALAQFREAAAHFERAQAALREATATVEALAQHLLAAPPGGAGRSGPGYGDRSAAVAGQLSHAATLITGRPGALAGELPPSAS